MERCASHNSLTVAGERILMTFGGIPHTIRWIRRVSPTLRLKLQARQAAVRKEKPSGFNSSTVNNSSRSGLVASLAVIQSSFSSKSRRIRLLFRFSLLFPSMMTERGTSRSKNTNSYVATRPARKVDADQAHSSISNLQCLVCSPCVKQRRNYAGAPHRRLCHGKFYVLGCCGREH
jgi:hypothetical protein